MKRFIMISCLSWLLVFSLTSCSRSEARSESNIAYGQVVKTDENTITVESGKYKYGDKFKGNGEEISYNLPENVFFDDFKRGDIVAILFDGEDAVAVTDVSGASGEKAVSSSGSVPTASLIRTDGEGKEICDEKYSFADDNKAAVLALNDKGRIDMSRVEVNTGGRSSTGIYAASGGAVYGSQVNLETSGNESPALVAGDRLSIIDFSDSTLQTSGNESPCVSSSGNVSLTDATGTSYNGAAVVIDRGGVVNLKNSSIMCSNGPAIEISEYLKNDKKTVTSKLMADNSSLKSGKGSPLIKISGTKGAVKMINSNLTSENNVLAEVKSDENNDGGKLLLYGIGQRFEGDVTCDRNSKIKVVLTEGSSFIGTLNNSDTAKYSRIYLSEDSAWTLEGDSYAGSVINEDKSCGNIDSKGYNIYYDKDNLANDWLDGKTIELKGGGKLMPSDGI